MSFDRRVFLRLSASAIGAGALSYALGRRRHARADASGHAARLIVFYFPDGVPGVPGRGGSVRVETVTVKLVGTPP